MGVRSTLVCITVCFPLVSCTGEEIRDRTLIADGTLRTQDFNGAELHYLAERNGPAIVFVHGGLADYREWLPVMNRLTGRYPSISYSRRHIHPNPKNQDNLTRV
jgi:hypothetical protein